MRYGDSFTYSIDVDPELLDFKMVKLTLQPLVENAIYHGMKQIRAKGHIRIVGTIRGEDGVIRVEDNGAGMSAEQLAQIKRALLDVTMGEEAVGFGVCNVHKRLQLNYGMSYGLSYESSPETGTVAVVTFRKK